LNRIRIARPRAAQRSIVSEIEAERRLVEGNRELIARMDSCSTVLRISSTC
jgi:hypothetical protein